MGGSRTTSPSSDPDTCRQLTNSTKFAPCFSFGYDPIAFYVLIVITIIVAVILVGNLYRSRLGRAWMAIREDEVAAAAMGINTVTTKLLAFAIGASFSGFAGAYYGASFGLVSPDDFLFIVSITVLVMVVLGGHGKHPGCHRRRSRHLLRAQQLFARAAAGGRIAREHDWAWLSERSERKLAWPRTGDSAEYELMVGSA